MRGWAAIFAWCVLAPVSLAFTAPAPAQGIADPVAYIRQAYAPAQTAADPTVDRPESQNPEYSQRLRALFADDERYAAGEVGRLEFNFWSNGQDEDIKNATVSEEEVPGSADRKVVTARFHSFRWVTTRFYFERNGGRWYLDDVASLGEGKDERPWTLSLILKYGQ